LVDLSEAQTPCVTPAILTNEVKIPIGDTTIAPAASKPTTKGGQHYTLIDGVRGIAAVAVLLYHYGFFYSGHENPPKQPLYAPLQKLYAYGYLSVELFWTISGFVFAVAYYNRSRTTGYQFFVARFSRLYPLHFATLVIVAVLQIISLNCLGELKASKETLSGFEFFRQLFMASSWGLDNRTGFNAPIWSVSIEILVYLLFFILLRVIFRYGIAIPLLLVGAAISPMLAGEKGHDLLYCIAFFFSGVTINILHRKTPKLALLVAALLIGLSIVAFAFLDERRHQMLCLFPASVAILAHLDVIRGHKLPPKVKKALKWLGDSSYAIYLLHFPLIIIIIMIIDAAGADRVYIVSQWWLLAIWMAAIIISARLTYVYFEMPAQAYLRKKMTHLPKTLKAKLKSSRFGSSKWLQRCL